MLVFAIETSAVFLPRRRPRREADERVSAVA
jgi:hypothetical protein